MLYQTDELAEVRSQEYLEELCGALHKGSIMDMEPVQWTVKVEKIAAGVDTAIPLGLIITELVSDSLQHAFTQGFIGTRCINIILTKKGGNCYSTIQTMDVVYRKGSRSRVLIPWG